MPGKEGRPYVPRGERLPHHKHGVLRVGIRTTQERMSGKKKDKKRLVHIIPLIVEPKYIEDTIDTFDACLNLPDVANDGLQRTAKNTGSDPFASSYRVSVVNHSAYQLEISKPYQLKGSIIVVIEDESMQVEYNTRNDAETQMHSELQRLSANHWGQLLERAKTALNK